MRMLALWLVLGCGGTVQAPPTPDAAPLEPDAALAITPSVRGDLRAKTWRQLSADLEVALDLAPDEVCRELGVTPCTEVHQVRLGGVDWTRSLYSPLERHSLTRAAVLDRMALAGCARRAALDAEAAPDARVIAGALDPRAPIATGGGEDATADAIHTLYRRLLARDPVDAEVAVLLDLRADPALVGSTNEAWLTLACMAVATTTEGVFY